MMSASLVLGGQLLGTAFACGLNLYATIALLGIAGRLEWVAGLPPGMRGLENGIVIGAAAALFLAEFVVDRIPVLDTVWEAVHTIIRPAAAGLLALLALQGAPLHLQLGVAAAAALTALAAHGTKAGLRLILATRRATRRARAESVRGTTLLRSGLSLLEDVAAVGLVLASLLYPGIAVSVLAASLLLLLLAGPRLWRAAFLGLFAVVARLRGFFGDRGWRPTGQMPRHLRGAVAPTPLGCGPARAVRATVSGLPGTGAYRHGWLVFAPEGPSFVYRANFRTRSTPVPKAGLVELRTGILSDALELRTNGGGRAGNFTIYLLKDGPPAAITAAELENCAP
jgi:hypothetical protein